MSKKIKIQSTKDLLNTPSNRFYYEVEIDCDSNKKYIYLYMYETNISLGFIITTTKQKKATHLQKVSIRSHDEMVETIALLKISIEKALNGFLTSVNTK